MGEHDRPWLVTCDACKREWRFLTEEAAASFVETHLASNSYCREEDNIYIEYKP